MDPRSAKQMLRAQARQKLQGLLPARRLEAEEAGSRAVRCWLDALGPVLSYASFAAEFSTAAINGFLAQERRLLLPKMEAGGRLRVFHVEDPSAQLMPNAFGIPEPVPDLCREAKLTEAAAVLVPGLAFDSKRHRLGYGKGCYDRFLCGLSPDVPSIGVGFREQSLLCALPLFPTDVPLTRVLLF